ncbi:MULTISPECIES: PfkB family carbohydrate kinase [Nocardia]|uniref:PfkB family carbohydrate kinase n=1 Tax=Nocardia TaxID=1817 RepID=UPI000D69C103|nr:MULTISPECIES: PfkB family carbohydrate kinase [Nocardia]
MAAQDSATVAVRNVLARLGKHRGLAEGADRLRTTQVDIAPLLELPVVEDRARRDELPPNEVVLSVVREFARRLAPTDRLIADAALALGLLRENPPVGIDFDRLYAADLGARREYLTQQWLPLHESLGATAIPTRPTVRTLRATPERRAFTALAALLAAGIEVEPEDPAPRSDSASTTLGTVTVIGAAVIDHTYRTDHIPTADGRPALGRFKEQIGGKGLNRAVAVARLGFQVRLIAAVGDDPAGRRILRYLRKEGVDTELVKIVPGESTPVAAVIMAGNGTSAVIGNADDAVRIDREDLNAPAARRAITEADAVLMTFEQPMTIIEHTLEILRSVPDGPWLLVQPTPSISFPQYLYEYFGRIDYLIGSEQELRALLSKSRTKSYDSGNSPDIPEQLLTLGIETVCTVQGFECTVHSTDKNVIDIRRFAAAQLDESLGARAAFMAALVHRLITRDRRADREAFRWATAAMVATQSFGDIPGAMPDTGRIDRIARSPMDDDSGG